MHILRTLINLNHFAVPHGEVREDNYKQDERREAICSTKRSHHFGIGLVSFCEVFIAHIIINK